MTLWRLVVASASSRPLRKLIRSCVLYLVRSNPVYSGGAIHSGGAPSTSYTGNDALSEAIRSTRRKGREEVDRFSME